MFLSCFLQAISEYPIASEYLKNYQTAVDEIKKCSEECPAFADLAKDIICKGIQEVSTLEGKKTC